MPDPAVASLKRHLGPAAFHDISGPQLVDYLLSTAGRGQFVSYLNAHSLNLVLKDKGFASAFHQAGVCFCDGFGVVLLARIFRGMKIAHRITGPDFLDLLYERIVADGRTLYLLGDMPENVASYAENLRGKVGDRLLGYHHGYLANDPSLTRQVLDEIERLRPDVLLIGMGMPRQELWAAANRERLAGQSCLMVGAAFAWGPQSGRRRGPRWATDRGLEWFFRLLNEPRLVWRRYLVGLPEVTLRVAGWYLRQGWRRK